MLNEHIDPRIVSYCEQHSTGFSELLRELQEETQRVTKMPQMLSGPVEGRLLSTLIRLAHATSIVEVGTFTGYSALCMAEGLSENGRLVTCEIDPYHASIAQKYFDKSPHGKKIVLKCQDAMKTLSTLEGPIDLAFIDADKTGYKKYYEALLPKLRSGGLVVFDNTLWGGQVLDSLSQDPDTRAIVELNQQLRQDPRVDVTMLSVRDGVTLAYKK